MLKHNGIEIVYSAVLDGIEHFLCNLQKLSVEELTAMGITKEANPIPPAPTQEELDATRNADVHSQIHQLELQDVMGRPVREAIAADATHPAYTKYKALNDQIVALRATLV